MFLFKILISNKKRLFINGYAYIYILFKTFFFYKISIALQKVIYNNIKTKLAYMTQQ
jgi:hypothetical protein